MNKLKIKFALVGFLFVLLVNPQIVNPASAVTDSNPPTLDWMGFDKATVYPGEFLKVFIGVSDDISGVSDIEIAFADPNGEWKAQAFPTYNSTSGYWESNILINQFWLSGIYTIDFVYLSDYAGNYIYLWNNVDYLSTTVSVSGTTPDVAAPTIGTIFFQGTIATPTTPNKLSLNVSDDLSGINSVEAGIADPTGEWKAQVFPTYNTTSGYWESPIMIGQNWLSGNYYVDYIYTVDNAGNSYYYYNGSDFFSPSFQVTGTTPDTQGPTLWSILFNKVTASSIDPIRISLNISDDLSGIDFVEVAIADPSGTWKVQPFPVYNSSSGLYDAFIFIDQYWSTGTYYVDFVHIKDLAGNEIYLYNGTDFTSPTFDVLPDQSDIYPPTIFANITNFRTYSGAFNVEVISTEAGWGEVYMNGTFVQSLTFTSPATFWLDTFQFMDGYYNLTIFASDNSGNEARVTYWIYIQNAGPPGSGNQEIKLLVNPNHGESVVNETVDFKVDIETSFIHDMPNVTLVVQSVDPINPVKYYTNSFFLGKQSIITFTVPVTFIEEGHYVLDAVLYDDILAPWVFTFEWDVVTANPITTTSDNTSNANTTETSSISSSETPGLPVPGFSNVIAMFAFVSLVVIRMKKKTI